MIYKLLSNEVVQDNHGNYLTKTHSAACFQNKLGVESEDKFTISVLECDLQRNDEEFGWVHSDATLLVIDYSDEESNDENTVEIIISDIHGTFISERK